MRHPFWLKLLAVVSVGGQYGRRSMVAGVSAALFCMAASAQEVMGIPGEFAVSKSGAATYSIQLETPPGIGGMSPMLSLSYNSQNKGGLIGEGWDLGGPSAITRCPRTQFQDSAREGVKLDMNDRFCLDGQRLMVINGTYGVAGSEYRTQLESFNQIIASGSQGYGPASFTVKTKSGLTLTYGGDTASRVLSAGTSTVANWLLSSAVDAKGNTIAYAYSSDSEGTKAYLFQISYGPVKIHIDYEQHADADVRPSYRAGSLIRTNHRPTQIKINVDDAYVYRYLLSYDSEVATRLVKVTRCDMGSQCLPAIDIGWQPQSVPNFNASGSGNWLGYIGTTTSKVSGDFNGDGVTDLAHHRSANIWQICLSTKTGFNCADWAAHSGDMSNNVVGDFNGDGLSDLMTRKASGVWEVCLSTGTSFNCADWAGHSATLVNTIVGDFNGDGRMDIAGDTGADARWHLCLSKGNGFTCSFITALDVRTKNLITADFNGDGRTDVGGFLGESAWRMCLAEESGLACKDWVGQGSGKASTLIGDFNGDGLMDMMGDVDGAGKYAVCYSTGKNFACKEQQVVNARADSLYVGDFNGDGLDDVGAYVPANNAWSICLSSGDRFKSCTNWPGHAGKDVNNIVGDFNGDGVADLAAVTPTAEKWHVALSNQKKSLVTSITQPAGHSVSTITYQPLTHTTTYTKDSGASAAVYPKVDVMVPIYVVRQSKDDNGIGGTVSTTYTYGGLKAEQGTGRGLLGFRWTQSKQSGSNLVAYTEYSQAWPCVAFPITQELRLSGKGNNGVLKSSVTTCKSVAGLHSSTKFIYGSPSTESAWDLNGTAYPVKTTTTTYGQSPQWGDPTKVVITMGSGESSTTVHEYFVANTSAGNWIPAKLKKATVTAVTP